MNATMNCTSDPAVPSTETAGADTLPHFHDLPFALYADTLLGNQTTDVTGPHQARTAELALQIGRLFTSHESGHPTPLTPRDISILFCAAALHDIGKKECDQNVINFPGKYNREQREEAKKHAEFSYDELIGYSVHAFNAVLAKANAEKPHLNLASFAPDDVAAVQAIAETALHHHEKMDGSGYPFGFTNKDIPFLSKLLSVADVFEALTDPGRRYKKPLSKEAALAEMKTMLHHHLDPVAFRALSSVIGLTLPAGNAEYAPPGQQVEATAPHAPSQPAVPLHAGTSSPRLVCN